MGVRKGTNYRIKHSNRTLLVRSKREACDSLVSTCSNVEELTNDQVFDNLVASTR